MGDDKKDNKKFNLIREFNRLPDPAKLFRDNIASITRSEYERIKKEEEEKEEKHLLTNNRSSPRTPLDEKLKLNGIYAINVIHNLEKAGIIKCLSPIEDILNLKNNAKITIIVNDPHEWAWSIVFALVKNKKSNFKESMRGSVSAICDIFNFKSKDKIIEFNIKNFTSDRDTSIDYIDSVKKILNL